LGTLFRCNEGTAEGMAGVWMTGGNPRQMF
jgi:hypothetical protein